MTSLILVFQDKQTNFHLKGEVIGINTWISEDVGVDEGLNFAVPINDAQPFPLRSDRLINKAV
ncbi:hypothetical protein ACFLYB_01015 [Chloroflexota bacterium]